MSEVNKFYDYNNPLSFSCEQTAQKVIQGKDLKRTQIENLCADFFTNRIYATVIEDGKTKDEALKIAAQVVVKHGEEIKEQLKKNDEAVALEGGDKEQSFSGQSQPNTSEDIKKISGGTMAQIITKIAEIMASMSPQQRASMAQNLSALFEVLGVSFDKMSESMQKLAEEPILISIVKDILTGTSGEEIFGELIKEHLNSGQKEKVDQVSKEDLKEFGEKVIQQQEAKVVCR